MNPRYLLYAPEQLPRVRREATRRGISMADWIREAINEKLGREALVRASAVEKKKHRRS